jgi:hypothetical protein
MLFNSELKDASIINIGRPENKSEKSLPFLARNVPRLRCKICPLECVWLDGSSSLLVSPNQYLILQKNLLTAAVVEFRSTAVGVASDPLSGFKGAVIFQKIRDAGRPE